MVLSKSLAAGYCLLRFSEFLLRVSYYVEGVKFWYLFLSDCLILKGEQTLR